MSFVIFTGISNFLTNFVVALHIRKVVLRMLNLKTLNAQDQATLEIQEKTRIIILSMVASHATELIFFSLLTLRFTLPAYIGVIWPLGVSLHLVSENVYQYNLKSFFDLKASENA